MIQFVPWQLKSSFGAPEAISFVHPEMLKSGGKVISTPRS